jgi:hypothetical protein
MSVTTKLVGAARFGYPVHRHVETGSANTELVVSVPMSYVGQVLSVMVAYSATPTQTGVVTSLDAGAGAAYDTTLDIGIANQRYTVYSPPALLVLGPEDALLITAPAGGAGITASVSVYTAEV